MSATVPKITAALALTSLLGLAQAAELQGRVVGIADGDTLTVLDSARTQHKVRIAGINVPEKRQA